MMADFSSNSKEDYVENELTFSTLQDLLQAGDWRRADYETCQIIIQSDWRNPSKEVLRTLDRLWAKFSDGHFGFGIQQKIYFECRGKPSDMWTPTPYAWSDFAERIGWITESSHWVKYEDLIFDISAPKGHLPCFGGAYNHYIDRRCGGGSRFYHIALRCFL